MSPFQILLELRMMEVVSGGLVTTGVVRRAKLQSNRHHQQTNTQFFFVLVSVGTPNVPHSMISKPGNQFSIPSQHYLLQPVVRSNNTPSSTKHTSCHTEPNNIQPHNKTSGPGDIMEDQKNEFRHHVIYN